MYNCICGFQGTCYGPVAQLVRAPPCHGGGHGFEPHSGRLYEAMNKFHTKIKNGVLAQLGEHLPYKQRVIGSSPIGPTKMLICILSRRGGIGRRLGLKIQWEEIPVPVRVRLPALVRGTNHN